MLPFHIVFSTQGFLFILAFLYIDLADACIFWLVFILVFWTSCSLDDLSPAPLCMIFFSVVNYNLWSIKFAAHVWCIPARQHISGGANVEQGGTNVLPNIDSLTIYWYININMVVVMQWKSTSYINIGFSVRFSVYAVLFSLFVTSCLFIENQIFSKTFCYFLFIHWKSYL